MNDIIEKLNECLSDRRAVKSLLSDMLMDDKQKINTMLIAYDLGIVEELKSVSGGEFRNYSFAKKMISEYGLKSSACASAISEWKRILGVDKNDSINNASHSRIRAYYYCIGKKVYKCSEKTNRCLQFYFNSVCPNVFIGDRKYYFWEKSNFLHFDEESFCNVIEGIYDNCPDFLIPERFFVERYYGIRGCDICSVDEIKEEGLRTPIVEARIFKSDTEDYILSRTRGYLFPQNEIKIYNVLVNEDLQITQTNSLKQK